MEEFIKADNAERLISAEEKQCTLEAVKQWIKSVILHEQQIVQKNAKTFDTRRKTDFENFDLGRLEKTRCETRCINKISDTDKSPPFVKLGVGNENLKFQIDTGATLSEMNYAVFRRCWPKRPVLKFIVTLETYTGETVCNYGTVEVEVNKTSTTLSTPADECEMEMDKGGEKVLCLTLCRCFKMYVGQKKAVTSSDKATHTKKGPVLGERTEYQTLNVLDHGAAFTSSEFHQFMENNGIKHIRCASIHSATNGQAERGVQVFKEGVKYQTGGSLVLPRPGPFQAKEGDLDLSIILPIPPQNGDLWVSIYCFLQQAVRFSQIQIRYSEKTILKSF
ncbi:transposon ty3-i Gag-Pol polyprotein [Plakobranchus ocellatus]|uniref:Transposon ty3-i Gag-Pol polyprotein n=1 Tax=Plakobranchus ocellatus TaxID=259542 RepID=A0AAV4BBS4_9GAST|nr:transposon ty3-i Gag-Pol polyprotein [Plakobranchus ocellatus]